MTTYSIPQDGGSVYVHRVSKETRKFEMHICDDTARIEIVPFDADDIWTVDFNVSARCLRIRFYTKIMRKFVFDSASHARHVYDEFVHAWTSTRDSMTSDFVSDTSKTATDIASDPIVEDSVSGGATSATLLQQEFFVSLTQ